MEVQILIAINTKRSCFYVIPYSLVASYQCLGETYSLILQRRR